MGTSVPIAKYQNVTYEFAPNVFQTLLDAIMEGLQVDRQSYRSLLPMNRRAALEEVEL